MSDNESFVFGDEGQDLLFTDGLPTSPLNHGYSGQTSASAAGISYRQLDYWDRTGLIQPSVRTATGSGSQRLYAFRDILVLKLVKRLLDTGVSLQQIRIAIKQLREVGINDLAKTRLMSDGVKVYMFDSGEDVIDLIDRGHGVFGIAVGRVLQEVEATLSTIAPSPLDEVDELAQRRQSRRVAL